MSLVFPGIGTGALNRRRIQVSISRISHATSDEICSLETVPDEPVKIPQTVSVPPLPTPLPLLPTRLLFGEGEPTALLNEDDEGVVGFEEARARA